MYDQLLTEWKCYDYEPSPLGRNQWLGNFRDKNIFYDRKTGELYSIDKKEEKAPNLTWAILPASFLLRNIYSEATAPQVVSVPIRIFILCSTVLCVFVLIIFVLRNIRKHNVKEYCFLGLYYFLRQLNL